jgi:hypothetical protein
MPPLSPLHALGRWVHHYRSRAAFSSARPCPGAAGELSTCRRDGGADLVHDEPPQLLRAAAVSCGVSTASRWSISAGPKTSAAAGENECAWIYWRLLGWNRCIEQALQLRLVLGWFAAGAPTDAC